MFLFRKYKDYKILIIAISISFAWHLFWLSSVKLVSSKLPEEPVKYSKISFFGPVLTKINMELNVITSERSFLEKRLMETVRSTLKRAPSTDSGIKNEALKNFYLSSESEDRLRVLSRQSSHGYKSLPERDF